METSSGNRLQAYMPMSDLEGKREFNFQDIRGYQILNTTGHKVGTVKEVYVDPNTLEPCFAFLDYQKFMNFNVKSYLVPWEELIIGQDFVQTRWTEQELLPETREEQERNLAPHGGPGRSAAEIATGTAQPMTGATATGRLRSTDGPSMGSWSEPEVTSYDTGEGDEEIVAVPGTGRNAA